MISLTTDTFEKQWMAIAELPEDSVNRLMDDMASLQPGVLTYLLASGHEVLDEDQQELLLFSGVVLWRTYLANGRIPAAVDDVILDEREEKNGSWLERLFNAVEEQTFFEVVEGFAQSCPQADIVNLLADMLFEEFPEEPESRAVMMIYLKTVIDCFESLAQANETD